MPDARLLCHVFLLPALAPELFNRMTNKVEKRDHRSTGRSRCAKGGNVIVRVGVHFDKEGAVDETLDFLLVLKS